MKSNLHRQTDSSYYRLSLLTAIALWDGHLDANGKLAVQHSERQRPYLEWKAKLLSEAFGRDVSVRSYVDKNGFSFCRMNFCNDITKRLRDILYKDGRKKLSNGILSLLKSPVAMAIMHLDDGCLVLHKDKNTGKVTSREVYLSTNSFTINEANLFISWLQRNYGIVSKAWLERGTPRIRLNASNANRLFSLFADIPKSMTYKIDMKYVKPMPDTQMGEDRV
jgi:hypothetical protein